ncbi:MAG: NF038130 family PEP-CTERM protein [Nostoc sp. DedVER02]|uniref:NF038130 family PEP-CTERM protein n=1 Tax=unclassified Nostoc TaxID=2593658 RepID=UPI002AD571AA|nr:MULTISPECIES: NF038130 family PEP-CTERM protein [unclassified Nostoc]MDZ7988826.1 NF038130 family PEP-CTERM protein [Nostoc sp. DedVER02]MDZ8116365.1 NF038130 family PEP-CTERM protein [Nostoc sp. DedVER01b]
MTFQKLVIGASMAIGVSAIATVPAQAGTLTGATIGGTAASDYYVYDSDAKNTFKVEKPSANDVQKVLSGNAASPTGNVELRASSELKGFDFTKNTSLTGTIGGKTLTLSSLTSDDWFGIGKTTTTYGVSNLANTWFSKVLSENGITSTLLTKLGYTQQTLFTGFLASGGFQRFSDPNISYVNQDDASGLISIGLAGHLDAKPLLFPGLPSQLSKLFTSPLQASELVKYTYDGKTDYLYSFKASDSHLVEKTDGISHSGNYEVTIKGVPPAAVPEPSVMLGLLGVAGVFATQRKFKKASI